jgi:hypothetical protein
VYKRLIKAQASDLSYNYFYHVSVLISVVTTSQYVQCNEHRFYFLGDLADLLCISYTVPSIWFIPIMWSWIIKCLLWFGFKLISPVCFYIFHTHSFPVALEKCFCCPNVRWSPTILINEGIHSCIVQTSNEVPSFWLMRELTCTWVWQYWTEHYHVASLLLTIQYVLDFSPLMAVPACVPHFSICDHNYSVFYWSSYRIQVGSFWQFQNDAVCYKIW